MTFISLCVMFMDSLRIENDHPMCRIATSYLVCMLTFSSRYSPVAERSYDRDRNYSRSQEKRSRDRYERRSRSRDRRGSRSPVRRDRGSTRDLKRRSRSRSAEGDRRRSTGTGDRGRSGSHNRLSPGRDLSPRRQSDSGDDREH